MNVALIMAGGNGARMGADCPKQFLVIDEVPVLVHTIRSFCKVTDISKIVVVCSAQRIEETKTIVAQYSDLPHVEYTLGGNSRRESVLLGLEFLEKCCSADDIILIHDAARPFVSSEIIEANIAAVAQYGSAATVLPVQDTISVSEEGTISAILDRSSLYAMQTPQSFKLCDILSAHKMLSKEDEATVTDDVGVALKYGIRPALVMGDKRNFKITTKEDLIYAQFLTKN